MAKKIAPDVLDALSLARGSWGLSNEAQERAVSQARALLAVARAAERVILIEQGSAGATMLRDPLSFNPEDVRLARALRRLDAVSRRTP